MLKRFVQAACLLAALTLPAAVHAGVIDTTVDVPEPGTLILLGLVLGVVGMLRRKASNSTFFDKNDR